VVTERVARSLCTELLVRRCEVMEAEEFRTRAKQMVDYVADYLENIRDRRPLSCVQPGYLRQLVPDEAPRDPETWNDVFSDIERVIMPGVSSRKQQFCRLQLCSDYRSNLTSSYLG